MILELKGIYKNYQQGKMSVPVLKDVNFSMEEGEYVAIMGPSGSGKTTLMNIIGCLDKPTEGSWICISELSSASETVGSGKCRITIELCKSTQKRKKRTCIESLGACGTGRSRRLPAKPAFRWTDAESGDCQSNCQ